MRVLIVAEHASARFGGEAALPLHYFRVLRARGIDTWMITHARVCAELSEAFPGDVDRIAYVEDTALHRILWRLGGRLPSRLAYISTSFLARLLTQRRQRQMARSLVKTHNIDIVHQPTPVSPREPSLLHGLGAPLVIGPMNGNMVYPPAFQTASQRGIGFVEGIARRLSNALNTVIPGKRRAKVLIVANERTRRALPGNLTGEVMVIPEDGVDLTLWRQHECVRKADHAARALTHFAFMGRLVDWKAVDVLLIAFARASAQSPMCLALLGDGVERTRLVKLASELKILGDEPGIPGKVFFSGWCSQEQCAEALRHSDALLLPSLWECGGAVVLEAMACRLPVVATAWGGPLDYIDKNTGILVPPTSREDLIKGFSTAMLKLSSSPELRRRLGEAGRKRVEIEFDWERKVDTILEVYDRVLRCQAA